MNHRERFVAQMHYQPVDRSPLYDFNFWEETIPQWQAEGLPTRYDRHNAHHYFGLDASLGGGDQGWDAGVHQNLLPAFEREVLEDRGKTVIVREADGVIVETGKQGHMSIPMHVGHTLNTRGDWETLYKPKLDPTDPNRIPADFDQRAARWTDPDRDHPLFVGAGSLYGWIRNWMGVEGVTMAVYDDPAWFEEMVETITDLQLAMLEKVLSTGATFEACAMWEDMCYNAGPLLSPTHFKRFLVPNYKRITALLSKHGIDIVWVDCDGKIDDLLPLWLEAGVNCMFPLEVGTWGGDPRKFRAKYGRDLLLMGGFDKHVLARSKDDITAEIHRLAPLVEEGGYIGFCDHRVPPDVPLENYVHYCKTVRKVWGKGVNLPAMEASTSAGVDSSAHTR